MTYGWSKIRYQTTDPLAAGNWVVIDVERAASAGVGAFSVTAKLTAGLVLRAGKIIRFKLYQDRAAALAAAGLSE